MGLSIINHPKHPSLFGKPHHKSAWRNIPNIWKKHAPNHQPDKHHPSPKTEKRFGSTLVIVQVSTTIINSSGVSMRVSSSWWPADNRQHSQKEKGTHDK